MATTDNYGLFWDSNNGDRMYNAESFETWLKHFFRTGVFEGELEVVSTGGMTVNVGSGYCNVDGKVKFFGESSLTFEAANSTFPRIDTVVIERNDTDRDITVFVVKGEYSGSTPAPTAPVRTGGVFQIVLAQVYIDAGVTEITQADITDTRSNTEICGIVTGTVEEMDFEQFTVQFASYYSQWQEDIQQEFLAWYSRMQGQLSEDAAGNLQEQIDNISYYYVRDEVLHLPNTAASVSDGILTVGTTEG